MCRRFSEVAHICCTLCTVVGTSVYFCVSHRSVGPMMSYPALSGVPYSVTAENRLLNREMHGPSTAILPRGRLLPPAPPLGTTIDSKSQYVYPFLGKAVYGRASYLDNKNEYDKKNSSDLESGRRPNSISDEFFIIFILHDEIISILFEIARR